jgi:hypothetical protein
MTVAQVYEEADKMSPGARLAAWMICGRDKHPLQALPRAAITNGAFRYCEKCWTAFEENGAAINAPPAWKGIR